MKLSKELEDLLERQNSDTDRKKILEQQSLQRTDQSSLTLGRSHEIEMKMDVNVDLFVQLKKG